MPEIYRVAMRYRAALRAENDAALARLVQSYGRIYERLQTALRALEADILEAQAAGVDFSVDWLRRQGRYRELLRQVEEELGRYGAGLGMELDRLTAEGIARGEADALGLTAARLPGLPQAALQTVWNRLPTAAVETLLGFLAPDSPLTKRLAKFGPEAALRIGRALEESVAAGYSPRVLAETLRRQAGMSLTDALRMARTTQVNAYREASRLAYLANEKLVPTWTWCSALDPAGTCLACIAKHGSVHPVTERLNDHHNGWCVMLPNPVSYRELGLNVDGPPAEVLPTGEAWLKGLPEAEQRVFFSGKEWEAWQAGKVGLQDFLGRAEDRVWGEMVVQRGLTEALGGTGQ